MLVFISTEIKACFPLVCYFLNLLSFCLFIFWKYIALPWLSMTFTRIPWLSRPEIELVNSTTFQVFYDLYKPCVTKFFFAWNKGLSESTKTYFSELVKISGISKIHEIRYKCFSCWWSSRKRQETKFSHTEWGTWVRTRMLVSRSVTWVSFLFLKDSATVFSHPLVSCCLEFILEVCRHVFPVVFSPFLSTLTLWCWSNCQLSAVALSCGRQKMHSVCEKSSILYMQVIMTL